MQVGCFRLASPDIAGTREHPSSGALRRVGERSKASGKPCPAAVPAPALASLGARVSARLAAARSGDLFRQIDERATDLRILDRRISADQADGAGGLQEAQTGAGAVGCDRGAHIAAEEECDGNIEHVGNARQTSRADPVDAFLVLLHLLKSNSQVVRELGL